MSSWVHSSHWGEKTLDAGLCWPGSPLPGPRVASLPKKQAGPDYSYGAQDRKYVLLLFRIVSGWSENTITQWSRRGGVRDFWVKFFLLLFWPYMVSFYV